MSHIEDEYRNRFKNEQLPSDDFDAGSLWDDISEDLDKNDPIKRKNIKPLWFVLFFIGIGVVGVLFFNKNNWKKDAPNASSEQITNKKELDLSMAKSAVIISEESEENNLQSIASAKIETTELKSKSIELRKSSVTKNSKQNHLPSSEKNSSTQDGIKNDQEFSTADMNKISEINSTTSVGVKKPQEFLVKNENDSPEEIPSSILNNTPKQIKNTLSTISNITNLSSLPTTFSLLETRLFERPSLELPKRNFPEGNGKSITWKMGIFGGINLTNFSLDAELYAASEILKEKTIKNEWGTSLGINTTLVFKNRWLLSSGLEYHQLASKFDYVQTQTSEVEKTNQLLRVWIDANTNDTLNTAYGTDTVNSVTTRKIVHYNQYKLFSIPLEIGFQSNNGKLLYGVTTGVAFNFITGQSGKTLDKSDAIISFDKNSSAAHFKNFGIGYRISPLIGYRFSEQWNIVLRPQLTWHTNPTFDDAEFKIHTQQFNLNIGVEYNFK